MVFDLYSLNYLTVFVRLMLAIVFGAVIGLDRGRKRRAAGLRTHMLVCLGSALTMMTNQYVANIFDGTDPTRMGAQVISGIGFLGVGTIIVTQRQQVKGLTTAAGLWASACMGLAVGIGFYQGALISFALIVVIVNILNRVDNAIYSRSKVVDVYMEFDDMSIFRSFLSYGREHAFKVHCMEVGRTGVDSSSVGAILNINLQRPVYHDEFIGELRSIEGVRHTEEI